MASPLRITLAAFLLVAGSLPAQEHGLRVAEGFRVSLYSDHELANDIYALTLDTSGRVVVTSQGWVKVLHPGSDGRAERASLFAETKTGGMGLCFDGNDLYFCGDGWFSCYRDADGDGRADGPPERIAPLVFNEHGGHAMRKGPDGWWYVIAGNDSGLGRQHINFPASLVRAPEAGGLFRLSPDLKQSEVIAHGWRNPYDFDFTAAGDLLTYDSDTERDFFLPWYQPTRVYHVHPGGHHGWRLAGYLRSWPRRDYFADTVDILAPIGRGSPTGVACYRHHRFPEKYRGGLFILDWTFGKIWFLPLRPLGTSYRTKPEVFLESLGTSGFAPTDIAVAPDGALFVSMGGRRTRGAVYRIDYVGSDAASPPTPATELDQVLQAPQPLDAWSRARWLPLARKLGPRPFEAAVADDKRPPADRVRAVEVLTELFSGLPGSVVRTAARSASPAVRARVAWSLGRHPLTADNAGVLVDLARDDEPRVRCAALVAGTERILDGSGDRWPAVLPANLGHADKRVRLAAALLASRLPGPSWSRLHAELASAPPAVQLGGLLAELWRQPQPTVHDAVARRAVGILAQTTDIELRLQALRLIVMALGDYRSADPPIDAFTGYMVSQSLEGKEKLTETILEVVRPMFPAGDEKLDIELSRLLAILEDDDPETLRKVARQWTPDSSATLDTHYLVVFARLRGQRSDELSSRCAEVLLSLNRKLQGQEQRNKQNWNTRLAELLGELMRHDGRLARKLLAHPDFVNPAHVGLALCLEGTERKQAAKRFLAAVQKDADFGWTGPLIELLSALPAAQVRPLLRQQWDDFGLRDLILLHLAEPAEAEDRERFLIGLESGNRQVVRACLAALEKLPVDPAGQHLVPLLRLLRQLCQDAKEVKLRAQVVVLINRQSGQSFAVREDSVEPIGLKQAYQPIFDWFAQTHPQLAARLNSEGNEDPAAWAALLQSAPWDRGDAARGEAIFRSRACATCHTGNTRIGPDLAGVTSRFSRDDLFTAIIYPSLDVAPAYRTEIVETRQGQVFSGLVIFFSADGVILQTEAVTTVRVNTPDIANRQPSNRSLMPSGLLKDLKPQDLADLYAYLQTLKPPR
jgi:putative membrane-bound dehydrogenase-like protein